MQPVRHIAIALIALTLAGRPAAAQADGTAPSATPPAHWKADASLAARLPSKPQSVVGYQLRIPRGFVLSARDGPNGLKAYTWSGPRRKDGTRTWVTVAVTTLPPAVDAERPLDDLLAGALQRASKTCTDFTASPPQHGAIDGALFVRAYWKAAAVENGAPIHGFVYVGRFGGQWVEIDSQDFDRYRARTLTLNEAAVLTFRPQ